MKLSGESKYMTGESGWNMFFFDLNYNMNTNKLNCPCHYWGTLVIQQLKLKKYWIQPSLISGK